MLHWLTLWVLIAMQVHPITAGCVIGGSLFC